MEPGDGFFPVKDDTLLFVVQGALQINYGIDRYMIGNNQAVLLRKDILARISSASHQDGIDLILLIIHLSRETLIEFVKSAQLMVQQPVRSFAVTIDSIDDRLFRFIESLDAYLTEPEGVDERVTRMKLMELLFNLARCGGRILPQLLDLRSNFRVSITSLMEDNLMNALSMSQLAMLAGRSLSSFRRDFQAIYNMSPSSWLRLRRLEKGLEMLLNTNMTVSDVCYTLGFESLAHFSRLFKNHFGYPPSRARAAILKIA